MPHEFTAQYHVFRPGPSRVLNFPHESSKSAPFRPGRESYPRIERPEEPAGEAVFPFIFMLV